MTKTDRQQITPDTVILYALPVLGDPPESEPPTAAGYRFANGLTLYGYDLPESAGIGQPVTLRFWWQSRKDLNADLTQYLHLDQADGDGFFVFDQAGFGGSFPFADWPEGVDALDTWTITLPAEMPPGAYHVYMGLYHTPTVERIPVKDGDGQAVHDYTIDRLCRRCLRGADGLVGRSLVPHHP